jgi:peptidoglycan/LPS O-acetylase OafA/YrhL
VGGERQQIFLIDAFKALAAQLIVLHHLAWYGPMSDVAAALSPQLDRGQDWLAEYGRYAVAAFLAVGGYLAAQTLKPGGLPSGKSPLCLVMQRYARLVGPYAIALILAVASASIARHWMTHDSIGSAPQLGQFFAHLFLLHDMLEYEALSAGVWYVAIDFQLYALLVLLLWGADTLWRRPAGADFFLGPLLVAGVALASLFFFNLDADWDHTALYFFGAYALGVGSRWAVESARPHAALLLVAAIGAAALALDFRPRIAVALVVAMSLGLAQLHVRMSGVGVLTSLSRTSYSLFLVHFPICLLVSAAFQHYAPASPALNAVGVVAAWLGSNLAAAFFYRHVEVRMAPWLSRWITCRRLAAA